MIMKSTKRRADGFIPTRRSLLSRVRNLDDETSWRDFYDTYWKLIYKAALQSGLSPTDAEDVVQKTFISVSRKIPEFKYDPAIGSFKGWLLRNTRWRILEHLRKQQRGPVIERQSEDPEDPGPMELIPDPVSARLGEIWDQEWQHNLMDAAIQRVKRQVQAKHFQVFELYALKQRPAEKVAETLKVTVAQVHLIKHRVGTLIRKEVERLEAEGV